MEITSAENLDDESVDSISSLMTQLVKSAVVVALLLLRFM